MNENSLARFSIFRSYEYTASDNARFVGESRKSPRRTAYERDRARVLHSAALRRLGAKTQVLGPGSDDFIRTRLTHSLEVAQVGRELGKELGADPDVVDAACLAHDLGHPPFGHNGENILNELSRDIGGFEGNAQTFRIVTRLEAKVLTPTGESAGLNLTRATLDAICKYPWTRGEGPDLKKSQRKYCVYEDDAPAFTWMRADAQAGRRCLEAQIMDLSDDIGYSVHDVEDAIATGKVLLSAIGSDTELGEIIDVSRQRYDSSVSEDELENAARRLFAMPEWLHSFTGSQADQAHLKDLTSELIGRFCTATVNATIERFHEGPHGRYNADLVIPRQTSAEIQILKGIAARYVMRPRETAPIYFHQRQLIVDLVDALVSAGASRLDEPFATYFRQANNDTGRLRAIIDQVATLTDASASRWHESLCGLLSTQLEQ